MAHAPVDLLLIRSAPLNVTPAVERYARFLRAAGFDQTVHGLELDYGAPRPPVTFVDQLHSFSRPFEGTVQRVVALASWQFYQLGVVFKLRPRAIQFCDVFSVVPALAAKLLLRSRLVYDIRDVAKLALSHKGFVPSLVLGTLEAAGAVGSDGVVVVDAPLVEALPRASRAKTFVVPNAPHHDFFPGLRFHEDGRFRVNLAGFVSYRRNLAAWCAVSARRTDVELDVYGTVADEETRQILARAGVCEVRKVPHEEALRRTLDCDAVALMYDPSIGINRYAAPNKYYEALMLGKPIVCAVGMGLAREVEEWQCGLVLPYGDEAALELAVDRLQDLHERRRLGQNARNLFEAVYRGRAEREMGRLYRSVGLLDSPQSTCS